jgi:hypothetical protein
LLHQRDNHACSTLLRRRISDIRDYSQLSRRIKKVHRGLLGNTAEAAEFGQFRTFIVGSAESFERLAAAETGRSALAVGKACVISPVKT